MYNSTFLGEEHGFYMWSKKGFTQNVLIERASDRMMVEINEVSSSIKDFDTSSFRKTFDKEKSFQLPDYCLSSHQCYPKIKTCFKI